MYGLSYYIATSFGDVYVIISLLPYLLYHRKDGGGMCGWARVPQDEKGRKEAKISIANTSDGRRFTCVWATYIHIHTCTALLHCNKQALYEIIISDPLSLLRTT